MKNGMSGSDVVQLDERKLKILQAIIRNYLETGEPVGSRTISKYTDLNLSSATIRNEMSDLEDMGYILQPHTSAGRIPSDKGYRLYVDTMMGSSREEMQMMREELEQKADKMDVLLKQVAKLLASSTNYATLVSAPKYEHKTVKFIQITKVDEEMLLAVIVLSGNIVKNKMIPIDEPLSDEEIMKLNFIMNTSLNGLDLTEINMAVIQQIKLQLEVQDSVINTILDIIAKAILEEDDLEIYTSGATNILKYPELRDTGKATKLLDTFEEKQLLTNLIADRGDEDDSGHSIQVYIGDETSVESLRDCSLVTAKYRIEDGVYGKIGIVGPKRMDYDKVVGTLQNLMEDLDDIFKDKK